ncbi:MAG: 6-carboxytetrahydropterin synthase QueD [Dehalococcoidales bacterium]|jgi:6-pyruvoyltetrahydropterin/6-carboxytetrahydropterin synthase|nr:6-carboxytetrahydropterin synthase QueD [Dehalococcoidales bacterium]MDD3994218.1 6-carboxytetrahydropterin synthase QueD [Dehalococcoidales bacterium]NLT27577.1 6-carboxytetrahydropterin synthase QueD [Dehalococcoidales bacterium]
MYKLSVEEHFDAAHALRGYKGKCENLHGHRFVVKVKVTSSQLDDIGLAFDFTELKRILKEVLSRFDHTNLDETPPFDKINPSSENIARTVYEAMKIELKDAPVKLSGVKVWESPESAVEYRED